jgi:methylamine--corrinoid protein Co-methyltransferase
MISVLEIAERASTGPKIEEIEWNTGLFKKMQDLTERYKLRYSGPDLLFSVDDEYCDNLFRAAVDFLVESGVYCVSTNRIIKFTEDEIEGCLKEVPKEITIGEGKDARVVKKRRMNDASPVRTIGGGHSPWNEKLIPLPLVVQRFAEVERNDLMEGFNLHVIHGREIRGLPAEAYAARKVIKWMREGIDAAGRPGMPITYYPIFTAPSTLIAPIDHEKGLRKTDGVLLSVLPDIKVETNLMTASVVYEDIGCYRANGGAISFVGGFCGGVEGGMIENIVKTLAAWIVYRDSIQYSFDLATLKIGPTKLPVPPTWSYYAVVRALDRNTNVIRFGMGPPSRLFTLDLCAFEAFLTWAKGTIINTVLGNNIYMSNYHTPFHVAWIAEVSDATIKAKIKKEELGELIRKIDERALTKEFYEAIARAVEQDVRVLCYDNPKKFLEPLQLAYDFERGEPSEAAVQNCEKARKYLEDLGLEF